MKKFNDQNNQFNKAVLNSKSFFTKKLSKMAKVYLGTLVGVASAAAIGVPIAITYANKHDDAPSKDYIIDDPKQIAWPKVGFLTTSMTSTEESNFFINQSYSPAELGIDVSKIFVALPPEANVVYTVQDNSYDGELAVKINLTIGSATREIYFLIRGYKSSWSDQWLDLGNNTNPTTIPDSYFKYRSIPYGLDIPSSITSIGHNAFEHAQLYDGFTLVNTKITSIGSFAFSSVIIPKGFALPDTVTLIPDSAFENAELPADFALPDTVTSIGERAFSDANLSEGFTLANTSITSIGHNAFFGLTIPKGFALPDTVTSIDDYAFLTLNTPEGFLIPDTVTLIGKQAFEYPPNGFHWTKDGNPLDGVPTDGGHEYVVVKD